MREGVLCWYPFKEGASILDLSGGILTPLLQSRGRIGTSSGKDFDYAVILDPQDLSIDALKILRSKMNSNGRLLIAYENPYALRYWAGKGSSKTGYPYDSLFGRGDSPLLGKAELTMRLKQAGFNGQKWYYPLTDHWLAHEVYSQSYLPNEYLNQRFKPYIADDVNLQFDERRLYREVIRGGAFEFMCGAYLVEARVNEDDQPCSVDYAAVTAYREPSKRFATVVRNDGTVLKTALHPDGREQLLNTLRNHENLAVMGVKAVPMRLEGDSLVMPRFNLPTIWDYWVKKLTQGTFDENEMFSQFDRIRNAIYKSSVNGKCYWELVPANCFYNEKENELIFFDQEYCWENVSPDVAVTRAVWGLIYSPAFSVDQRRYKWVETLKKRYSLIPQWEELSLIVNKQANAEVFGNGYEILDKVTGCASRRLVRQRKIMAAAKKISELGFKNPAIYGYGVRGKILLRVLEDSGMEIPVIIDKKCGRYKTADDAPKEYDVLIISILNDGDIADELRLKVSVPVYTLEELIDEKVERASIC
jgi:hypothetical protein